MTFNSRRYENPRLHYLFACGQNPGSRYSSGESDRNAPSSTEFTVVIPSPYLSSFSTPPTSSCRDDKDDVTGFRFNLLARRLTYSTRYLALMDP